MLLTNLTKKKKKKYVKLSNLIYVLWVKAESISWHFWEDMREGKNKIPEIALCIRYWTHSNIILFSVFNAVSNYVRECYIEVRQNVY